MKIGFDMAFQNTLKLEDEGELGYSKFLDYLLQKKFEVETLEKYSKKILKDFDVLVLANPQTKFVLDYSEMIYKYVLDGGGLLLMSEWGEFSTANLVSDKFGIHFNKDKLVNFELHYQEKKEGLNEITFDHAEHFVIIHLFKKHRVTQGIHEVGYLAGCSLLGGEIVAVGDENTIYEIDEGFEDKLGVAGVISVFEKNGRGVFIGDSSLFNNFVIDKFDNKRLFENIFSWLCEKR